jgi:hypothetical protein
MADPEQFNADQLAFWNGPGGHTWVARQEHTDITLAPVSEALLALAAPASPMSIGCRPTPPRRRWTDSICWRRTSA